MRGSRQSEQQEQWFRAHLQDDEGGEEVQRLARIIRPAGHEAYPDLDAEGVPFIAVLIRGPHPARELERLMRHAGLFGYFVPLNRSFSISRLGRVSRPIVPRFPAERNVLRQAG